MKTRIRYHPSTDAPCGLCLGRPYRAGMPLCSGCRDALASAMAAEDEIAEAMAENDASDEAGR